jgi:hypothetical protein
MSIQLDNTNAGTVTLKPGVSGTYSITLPIANAAGALTNDGSGNMSFTPSGGGGSSLPITKMQAQSFGGF